MSRRTDVPPPTETPFERPTESIGRPVEPPSPEAVPRSPLRPFALLTLGALVVMGGAYAMHLVDVRSVTSPPAAPALAQAPSTPPSDRPPAEVQQAAHPTPPPSPPGERYAVLPGSAPYEGPDHPLVVLVEYADFQCPFCARVSKTVDELRTKYPDLGVYYEEEPLSFHPNAKPAAEAALAAFAQGDGYFWKFHDQLFANQSALTRANFDLWGREDGLDLATFDAALAPGSTGLAAIDAAIAAQEREATLFGQEGTPGFYIDGRPLSGAQPIAAFESIIDEEEAGARSDLASGVPEADLYTALLAGAAKSKPTPPLPSSPAAPSEPDPTATYRVAIGTAPMLGPRDAKVTIILFADFQCPFSGRLQATLESLMGTHPKDVRLVWKNLPLAFHANALPAAEVAMEARAEGRFWPVYDALFKGQADLDRAHLLAIAAANGLDVAKTAAAIDSETYKAGIERDLDEAKHFGVSGTPSMFINGKSVVGAVSLSELDSDVTAAASAADALVASGVAPSDVYSTLMKSALPDLATHPPL